MLKVVTGDPAGTAAAIAAQIGVERTGHVLTGVRLAAMDEARLAEEVMQVDLHARTGHWDKLRRVAARQANGLAVAGRCRRCYGEEGIRGR